MKNNEVITASGQPIQPGFKLAVMVATSALSVVLLAVAGCSTGPVYPDNTNPNAGQQGGDIVTAGSQVTATIVSVDHAKRLVVVRREDGTEATYKAAPNAFAYNDIKAGDVVKISVAEELAFFIGKHNAPPNPGTNTAHLHVNIPGSTQALVAEADTLMIHGKITNVDDWQDAVTIKASDGRTKTIRVGEAVDLSTVAVGDVVWVQGTEATVVLLEKP